MVDRFLVGSRVWPTDVDTGRKHTRWHLYWLPGPSINSVYDAYATALENEFGQHFSIQSRLDRHVTIGAVVDRPTWKITKQELADLHGMLENEFAQTEPFSVELGPVWVNEVSVLLDIRPDHNFVRMQEITAGAINKVFGAEAAYDWRAAGRPHLAIAYATGPFVDSGKVGSKMRRVTDQTASSVVYRVHALDVTQDESKSSFCWSNPLATIYLGTD